MYRIRFRSGYIVVQSPEVARGIENLVRFVEEEAEIDIGEAIRTIGFLKKYKHNDPNAVTLVRIAEKKLVELIKSTGAEIW